MKRIIMTMLLMMAVTSISFAQAPQKGPEATPEHKEKVSKFKEIMNLRLQIIKSELALSDEQFEKFAPIYRQYCHNIKFNSEPNKPIDIETASRKEINDFLRRRVDNNISMAMVRKSYILIFERVLTPQQVYKLYNVETKLIKQARVEYDKKHGK